jgi:hypothetical protein
MNSIFKAIQKSFDLLDLKKNWDNAGAQPMNVKTYLKALEFMTKVVNSIECDIECEIFLHPKGYIGVKFINGNANLLITINENGVSYVGTGPKKSDTIKVINSATYYVSSDVIKWINKNRKKSI